MQPYCGGARPTPEIIADAEKAASDLIEFQKSYIITFDKINQYPFTKHFNLNILEYLNNDSELLKSTNYRFDFPENKQMSKETFLENIYYRRRRNFGKALVE